MQSTTVSRLREQYEQDGFLIHQHSVLAPDILQRAVQGMDAIRQGVYDTGEAPPEGSPWKPGDDPNRLCKIEQPQVASHALREAITSPELGRLAGEITGANLVQVWWVQLLYKPSSTVDTAVVTNIGWHQDRQYWKDWTEDSELFTAWLALSDVTPQAGPMIFARGSHRWGLLDHGDFYSQDLETDRHHMPIPEGEEWSEVPAILPPGGVSFHHRLTFHGSSANTSGLPRRSLAIHLRTEKSEALAGSWVATFLQRPEICPVIYQSDAS